MTDAQTEARAIVSAIIADKRLATSYKIETLTDALVEHIATALAAKDAELAEVHQQYVDANEARIDAEAALAEARKALEPFAKFPIYESTDRNDDHQVTGRYDPFGTFTPITIGHFRAARRAREQGEENA